jgi:hypothetical protein
LAASDVASHAQDLLPEILRQAEHLALRRVAIADACQMSEATISRWASRQVRPHVVVAKAVIEAIRNMALRQAKLCEQTGQVRSRAVENV